MKTLAKPESPRNQFAPLDADAFFFDIDGTLLNTKDLIHYRALNSAMQTAYGVNTTIDGVAYHGMTDLGILRAALERVGVTGEQFRTGLPAALAAVRESVDREASAMSACVCSGIPEVLALLRSRGKLLGVASGNLESVGWHKVRAAGLSEFFTCGYFSDHCESRAEIFGRAAEDIHQQLPGGEICFIGDTPSDIAAARHTGAQIIAIATGIFPKDELLKHGPDLCVTSCAELLNYLEGQTRDSQEC